MNTFDPVVFRLSGMVRDLIDKEVWRESVSRGVAVNSRDPVVLERVCETILTDGQRMREEATRQAYGHLSRGRSLKIPARGRFFGAGRS